MTFVDILASNLNPGQLYTETAGLYLVRFVVIRSFVFVESVDHNLGLLTLSHAAGQRTSTAKYSTCRPTATRAPIDGATVRVLPTVGATLSARPGAVVR